MTAIALRRLSREEFVTWMAEALAGDPTLPRDTTSQGGRTSDVVLAWPRNRPDARPIVCVDESQLQEFFAFVSTYSTNVRPFTAYFRVMPLELIASLEFVGQEVRRKTRVAKLVAGASIAEAWMAAVRQAERPNNIPLLLQSSLSYVLGQTILANYDDVAFDWSLREWLRVQPRRAGVDYGSKAGGGSSAWRHVRVSILGDAQMFRQDHSHPISSFVVKAIQERSIRPDMLRALSTMMESEIDLGQLLVASREERISRFNAALLGFKRRGKDGLETEFLAGLMLAIAGNGSFEMLRSAREFEGWLDGATTWFGICSALFEESNVLSYANSVGRRVVRDMLRHDDPFDLPKADIASTELRFIESDKIGLGQLGLHEGGSLEVEVLPHVSTRVPLQGSGQAMGNPESRDALLRALDEMTYLANRARRIVTDQDGQERQGDLYKPRRPNRTK